MASSVLGRPFLTWPWRAGPSRVKLASLLCLLIFLPTCGSASRQLPQTPSNPDQTVQAALTAALESGNSDLAAETIGQLMGAEADSGIETRGLIEKVGRTDTGRRAIVATTAALRRAAAAPRGRVYAIERLRVSALTALAALGPGEAEKEHFFALLKSGLPWEEAKLAALAEAALLYDPDDRHWPRLLENKNLVWQRVLLRRAARSIGKDRRRAARQVEPLRKLIAEWQKPSVRDSRMLLSNSEVDTPFIIAGLTMYLLDIAGEPVATPTSGHSAARDMVARARAAIEMGQDDLAYKWLSQASQLPPPESDKSGWFRAAEALALKVRYRTAISKIAEAMVPLDDPSPPFYELARFEGTRFSDSAAEQIAAKPVWNFGMPFGDGAESYLLRRDPQRLIEAYCGSAAGRRRVSPTEFPTEASISNLNADFPTLLMDADPWGRTAGSVPEKVAEDAVRRILRRDPERILTSCVAWLIRAQSDQGSPIGASAIAALGPRQDLISILNETILSNPPNPSARHMRRTEEACEEFGAKAEKSEPDAASEDQRIDYLLACSRFTSVGIASSIREDSSPRLLALEAITAVWPSGDWFPARANRESAFARILRTGFDRETLNLAAMTTPLMSGRDQPAAEDGPPSQDLLVNAARLLLLTGNDPQVASWIVAKLSNYRNGDPAAMATTMSVLARSWDAIDPAIDRLLRAKEQFGGLGDADRKNIEKLRFSSRRSIATEAMAALDELCSVSQRSLRPASSGAGARRTCIGSAEDDIRHLATAASKAGLTSFANTLENRLSREERLDLIWTIFTLLCLHVLAWTLLLIAYPRSPAIQASVFWNPWVRKYLGLGYVQLLLLVVPPFTRRLLGPFRDGLTADGRLEEFRPEVYFGDIQGERQGPSGRVVGRIADLVPSVDTKIWLQARSGSGKSWFLRDLANRTRRPVIFLNATSCVGGITAALKDRTAGWVAESDFLEQLIHSGRVVVIIDGLNEVAADIRSDIVLFANRFARGRILIATQPVGTARPVRADRIDVLPLARHQIETFLAGRAAEVLGPQDDAAIFSERVRRFVDSLEDGSEEERRALLEFVSNPMDLRLVADLLAAGAEPDLLNLQEQQIRLVEDDYEAANGAAFPIAAFAEFLYGLRRDNKPLVLSGSDWPAERAALHARRLVLRDDAPDGGERWRFRHDKITDYFLYRAFQIDPNRQVEHLADNRFIGVYVLMARKMPREQARMVLTEIYWAGGKTDDFTIGKAFQDALEQKLALQRAGRAAGNLSAPVE